MGSRIPDKVFAYCEKIALKIARGETWQRDWETLMKTMYTTNGDKALAGALELPSTIPPLAYNSSDLDALMKKIEGELNQLGEDGQIANIDTQDQLQKTQHILRLIGTVSKQLNDTAMDVVRTIG